MTDPRQLGAGDLSDSKVVNHRESLNGSQDGGSCTWVPGVGTSWWRPCSFQTKGLGFEENFLLSSFRSVLSRERQGLQVPKPKVKDTCSVFQNDAATFRVFKKRGESGGSHF